MRAPRRSALVLACRNANAVGEGGMALRAGGGGEGEKDHLGSVDAQHADVDRVSD